MHQCFIQVGKRMFKHARECRFKSKGWLEKKRGDKKIIAIGVLKRWHVEQRIEDGLDGGKWDCSFGPVLARDHRRRRLEKTTEVFNPTSSFYWWGNGGLGRSNDLLKWRWGFMTDPTRESGSLTRARAPYWVNHYISACLSFLFDTGTFTPRRALLWHTFPGLSNPEMSSDT